MSQGPVGYPGDADGAETAFWVISRLEGREGLYGFKKKKEVLLRLYKVEEDEEDENQNLDLELDETMEVDEV
jgi:hypothetical protein